jgi:hypothetical protein
VVVVMVVLGWITGDEWKEEKEEEYECFLLIILVKNLLIFI